MIKRYISACFRPIASELWLVEAPASENQTNHTHTEAGEVAYTTRRYHIYTYIHTHTVQTETDVHMLQVKI